MSLNIIGWMMKISSDFIIEKLNELIPNPKCELEYNKDYELLIATVLSAQSTDKRVNMATNILFSKYDLNDISNANLKDIESIIKPVGTYKRKAEYIKTIANKLIIDYNGKVPNNREYLESLSGVGRKTTNVVLGNLFDVPAIAVDTHVDRVSKRLGLAKEKDDVLLVEKKLMKAFPKDKWIRLHHQLVLFGRYTCKSKNPLCDNCPFINLCKYSSNKK